MREADDLIITLRSWIKMADEDLRLAEVALSVPDEALHAGICFHSQQCIEKYIKSLLVSRAIPFPKVHDIGVLIELLPQELKALFPLDELERFSAYATVCRYPGD